MVLVLASNARAVVAALRPLGLGGFAIVACLQLGLGGLLGLAWWTIAPRQSIRQAAGFVWASLIAEAAANLLPFTQIAGAMMATRAAVLAGVRPTLALASNVADVTLEVAAQCLFTLAGLAVVASQARDGPASRLVAPMALAGLAVGVGVLAVLAGAQRWAAPLLSFAAKHMTTRIARTTALQGVLHQIYARPWRLAAGLALHLAAWLGTAASTWATLAMMGRPLPFAQVLAIESLQFAVRNAVFIAPLGLGVQEGAYAVLGPLFGLPVQAALALSLLKRGRDLVIGGPVLLSWQWAEARRRLRRAPP